MRPNLLMDRKILRGFLASLGILTLVGAVSHLSLNHLLTSTVWVDHTQEVITTSEHARSAITGAESEQRGYLLTRNDGFRRDFASLLADSRGSAARLCDLTRDNAEQSVRCAVLRTLMERRIAELEEVLDLERREGMEAAAAFIEHKGKGTMRSLDSLVAGMQARERGLLRERIDKRERTASAVRWALSLGMALAVVLLFGAMAVVERDIRRRVTVEAALGKARDEAESANRSKSDFLANMSHELRTPLNSVIGFAQVLLKNKAGNLADRDLSYLERIHGNGRHLLRLINSILDLSKIEAGKMDVSRESCDLAALLADMASEFAPQAAEKGLTFKVDVPARAAPVETDAGKLRQVLINLIANALKFTPSGSITLRVACEGGAPARIEVEDTGIGIPMDRQAAVFEAFQQADNSTARRFGGTGLGLTISRSLLKLLGFGLELHSEAGRGSRFTIRLRPGPPARQGSTPVTSAAPATPATPATHATPAAQVAQAREAGPGAAAAGAAPDGSWSPAPPATVPASRADGGGRNILVIDDDPDSRLLLSHHLADSGYTVSMAADGEQGLALARAVRPAAITLDLFMPGMTGWKVLKDLKSDRDLGGIPVIVVSIVASENRSRILGPVDFLDKPLDKGLLLETLRRHSAGPQRDVLVVEDDADARALMAELLREAGVADVRLAADGREGLRAAGERKPSLVLLDLMMPGVSGLDFLEAFRARAENWDVPVVVVTAQELTAEESARLEAQCATVLAKGADLEERLHRTLDGIWRKRSGA